MRCRIKKPSMNIYAIEIYPEYDYDLPLLAIDFSCLKKKTFVYINLVPLFNDKDYFGRYIEPLKPLFEKYKIFSNKFDWKNEAELTFYSSRSLRFKLCKINPKLSQSVYTNMFQLQGIIEGKLDFSR